MSGDENETIVWFNPSCSKCRSTRELLEERDHQATYLEYLKEVPSRRDLEEVMGKLGITDPRQMMRTGEPLYRELHLASAGPDELLEAMTAHPILIERPIVIRGSRAVIGRPPERVHQLFAGAEED